MDHKQQRHLALLSATVFAFFWGFHGLFWPTSGALREIPWLNTLHVAVTLTLLVVPILTLMVIRAKLHWQILAAMVGGALFFWVGTEILHTDVSYVEPLGRVFIRLLKMVIVPLVMTSIIVGVASVGDIRHLGRLGGKTIGYYLMTSMLAILLGLCLTNLIQPGRKAGDFAQATPVSTDDLAIGGSFVDRLVDMVPTNPVHAASNMDMLGMIIFSILFGVAMTQIRPRDRERLLPVIEIIFRTMMRLTEMVIALAPMGVFGLIVNAGTHTDAEFIRALGWYWVTIISGLSLHLFVVLPFIFFLLTRRSPRQQFRHMAAALTTAFSTSSSSATLPVTMKCVETQAGVSNRISSFVLPMGATINMDGTALYECAGVLFIAQVLGVDLNMSQQLIVVITALLASIGAAGIPSAGLVVIFVVLEAVGLRGDTVAIIVGAMLAVDRPLDMMRTAVNVFSDSVGTVVIGHSEGEIRDTNEAEAVNPRT